MEKIVQHLTDLYLKSPAWVQAVVLIVLLVVAGGLLIWRVLDWLKIKTLKLDKRTLQAELRERDRAIVELTSRATTVEATSLRQQEDINRLNQDSGRLSEQLVQAGTKQDSVERQFAECQQELNDLQCRFNSLQTIDLSVWATPLVDNTAVPRFVSRGQRKTRFVTVLNLKGGVGKTTLVANLGAAYAVGVTGKPLRVLLVDLDYQGTLSNLCVSGQCLLDRRNPHNRQTAHLLLDEAQTQLVEHQLKAMIAPVEGTQGMAQIIVADEQLDHVDFRQQARFAVEQRELRFLHRKIFHDDFVLNNYDLVLFDCPPRLTTSSVNALAASDFLVLPTGLAPNDIDAVPRTLQWLEILRPLPAFQAGLAGIILNRTYRCGTVHELTRDEERLMGTMQGQISRFKLHPDLLGHPAVLENVVGNRPDIARPAPNQGPFGSREGGCAFYRDLAVELYKRIER